MHPDEKTMPGIYNANDLCAFAFAVNNNKELRPWQTEDGKIHLGRHQFTRHRLHRNWLWNHVSRRI